MILSALGRFFGRGDLGDGNDPMVFLDEYAAVMNKHTGLKVYNGFKRGHTGLSIDDGFGSGMLLWLEDGQYWAVSMGGSNEFVECFCWGAVVEGGSGAVVELVGDGVEVWLVAGDGGSFG